MRPRIPGPSILGLNDLFTGESPRPTVVVIGGQHGKAPKEGGPPPEIKPVPKPPQTQTTRAHGQVLKAAVQTLRQASAVTKAAAKAATAHKRPAALTGKKTAVGAVAKPSGATAKLPVATARPAGATGRVPANLKPAQQRAVAVHQRAIAKSDDAARRAGQAALKAKQSTKALVARAQKQKQIAVNLRTKKGGARIGDLIEQTYAQIGALPDPYNPGYLDTGEPDPVYALLGNDMPADPGAGPMTDPGADPGTGGDPMADPFADADAGGADPFADLAAVAEEDLKPPPAPPMDQFIMDYQAVGGVLYKGQKGLPDGAILSYGLASRKTDISSGVPKTAGIDPVYHYGFVLGRYWDRGSEKGIPFGDNLAQGQWNHVKGRYILGGFRDGPLPHNWGPGREVVDFQTAVKLSYNPDPTMRIKNPKGEPYGPLVGNPEMPDFKALRCDANGNLFWWPTEAPDWATAELRQAAYLTQQAAKKAAADAAAAAAAARAKAQADREEEARRQEAENALNEKRAASEAAAAESRARAEAAATEAKTRAEQAELERQAQQVELEQAKESLALRNERARQEAEARRRRAEQEARARDILIKRAEQEPPPEDYSYEEGGYGGPPPGYGYGGDAPYQEPPGGYDGGGYDGGGYDGGGYDGGGYDGGGYDGGGYDGGGEYYEEEGY